MTQPSNALAALIARHAQIDSLAAAQAWRSEADGALGPMAQHLAVAQAQFQTLAAQAIQLRRAARAKSMFGWIFRSPEEKANQASQRQLSADIQSIRAAIGPLADLASHTPASAEERALMVKELKATKKEMQLEKREVNAEMRQIRTQARQKSANVGSWDDIVGTTPDIARDHAQMRRRIRERKENALAPHERTKEAVERRILALDRQILSLEALQ